MFAAMFSRQPEEADTAPAAFEPWTDDETEEQDHSLPVPWDWWPAVTAAAN